MKITTVSTLGIALLALLFSACGNAVNTTANNSAVNNAVKSNTAVIVNSNQTTVANTANTMTSPVSSANAGKTASAPPPPGGTFGRPKIEGALQFGKTESVILYVGKETGDYAAYCFSNDSEAGRAITAACKDGEQCEFVGEVDSDSACKVPGLEADLSASSRISKIESVKTLGRKK